MHTAPAPKQPNPTHGNRRKQQPTTRGFQLCSQQIARQVSPATARRDIRLHAARRARTLKTASRYGCLKQSFASARSSKLPPSQQQRLFRAAELCSRLSSQISFYCLVFRSSSPGAEVKMCPFVCTVYYMLSLRVPKHRSFLLLNGPLYATGLTEIL